MDLRKILWTGIASMMMFSCSNDDNGTPQSQNQAPVASAGDDRQAEIGSTVMLDASASTDADGDNLTYKWTFTEKPEASDAVIMGALEAQAEFVLDRAGTYIVNLEVNDGELTNSTSVNITNSSPTLETVIGAESIEGINEYIYQRGQTIRIWGDGLSIYKEDNVVTLGSISCKVVDAIFDKGTPVRLTVTIPEEAIGGDLVIAVGPHSATWPEPIRIMSVPVQDFIAQDPSLEQRSRSRPAGSPDKWKEIGFKFRPSKSGSIVAFYNSAKDISSDLRVTLWDTSTGMEIAQAEFEPTGEGSYLVLDSSISLETGKEYILSTFSDRWYNYIYDVPEEIYPITNHAIDMIEGRASIGFASGQPESHYPGNEIFNTYVPLGADMVFVEDIESN